MSFRHTLLSLMLFAGCGAMEAQLGGADDQQQQEDGLSAQSFYATSPMEYGFDSDQARSIRQVGAGMVRFQVVGWPGGAKWLDDKVNIARDAGLEVLLELNYATHDEPGVPDGEAEVRYWHANFSDSPGNAFSNTYGQIAGDVAKHYKGKVSWYEIWNEPAAAPQGPDNAPWWDGACGIGDHPYLYGVTSWSNGQIAGDAWGVCPRQLAVLAAKAYPAIKAADPAARVVAGNMLLHGTNGWVGTEYWKQVEKAPATAAYRQAHGRLPWDAVGFHPYDSDATGADFTNRIQDFKTILSSNNDSARLAITEYGWQTAVPSGGHYADEARQAVQLRSAFTVAKSAGLVFMMWFNFRDGAGADAYGVQRPNHSYKPSTRAFCEVAGATATCPVKATRPGERADGTIDPVIVTCVNRNGGQGPAGAPFDNGGGDKVHGWGAGQAQDFQGGTLGPNVCMHKNGADGATAWMVRGSIRTAYLQAGGALSSLGYPTADEANGQQTFEGGKVAWDAAQSRYRAYPGPNRPPRGNLDKAEKTRIAGWVHDPDAALGATEVRIYRNGALLKSGPAKVPRFDLISAGVAPNAEHGFDFTVSLPSGTSFIEARGVDTSTGAETVLFNARSITVP